MTDQKDIAIRPLSHFSTNGKLSGPIGAFDPEDPNDLLWEGDYANWRKEGVVEMAAAKMVEELSDYSEYCMDTNRAINLIRKFLRAARKDQQEQGDAEDETSDGPVPSDDMPIIITNKRFIREISADCWALLQQKDAEDRTFFCFGNNVAHLETEGADHIYPMKLKRDAMIGHLDKLGNFYAIRKNKDGRIRWAKDKPPKDVVDVMLAEAHPPLRRLQGVVNTPVITADGSCLTEDGYHSSVQLYIHLNGLKIPAVPDKPLATDIERAHALIVSELLGDFPFTSESDLAHVVGTMLTQLVRSQIDGPVPLTLLEAPSPGTGKGLLAELIVLIVTGDYPKVMTEAKGEEMRKRITSALAELPSVILIDNIRLPMDSAYLAAALTARIWTDRELGATRQLKIPVSCSWIGTGNNVSVSAEMSRRIVLARIDSTSERPWERESFRHHPLMPWVVQHRGELLWALLTMVRHWVSAGKPLFPTKMASFENWSEIIGGILEVNGIPGFLGNRAAVYNQAEAEGEAWRAFIYVWWQQYEGARVGTPELFELAKTNKLLTDLRAGSSDHGARVAFGMNIAGIRDRRIGDFWVRDARPKHGGGASYRLEKSEEISESDLKKDSPDYTDSAEPTHGIDSLVNLFRTQLARKKTF